MKKVLLILLALVMVFSFAACGGDDSAEPAEEPAPAEEATGEATPETPAEPEDGTFGLNEPGTLDGVELTLVGVEESSGGEFFKPDEGNVYLLPEFHIVNNSDEDVSISSIMSFTVYVDNVQASMDISATSASDKEQLDATISVGRELNGALGVQAPTDWSVIEIEYSDVLGTDKLIFRYEKQ